MRFGPTDWKCSARSCLKGINRSTILGGYPREYFNKKLKKDPTIINVASVEYAKVIKREPSKGTKIIDIRFLQQGENDWKQVVVHSKRQGLLSRFIIKNRLTEAEEVKGFDYEDYFFYPLSNDSTWTFVR